MRYRHYRYGGFTVVELIVSTFIITAAMLAFVVLAAQGWKQSLLNGDDYTSSSLSRPGATGTYYQMGMGQTALQIAASRLWTRFQDQVVASSYLLPSPNGGIPLDTSDSADWGSDADVQTAYNSVHWATDEQSMRSWDPSTFLDSWALCAQADGILTYGSGSTGLSQGDCASLICLSGTGQVNGVLRLFAWTDASNPGVRFYRVEWWDPQVGTLAYQLSSDTQEATDSTLAAITYQTDGTVAVSLPNPAQRPGDGISYYYIRPRVMP
jgi:hypothetical protein